MQDIINGRCGWWGTDELYVYHDEEWGISLRLMTGRCLSFLYWRVPKPD